MENKVSRRGFLKSVAGSSAVVAATMAGCSAPVEKQKATQEVPKDKMTYRLNNKGEKISILGYGCMRLPTVSNTSARESFDMIDQDMVNRHVD